MTNYDAVIADMFARVDKDEELIKSIMRVRDMVAASAAISDSVFDWDYPHSSYDKNTMTLTVLDLIKEEDESKYTDITLEELQAITINEDDDGEETEKSQVQT